MLGSGLSYFLGFYRAIALFRELWAVGGLWSFGRLDAVGLVIDRSNSIIDCLLLKPSVILPLMMLI